MGSDRVSLEVHPVDGHDSPAVSAGRRSALVVPFARVGLDAIPQVGGKNASLGEMIRELGGRGVRVPDGFATTADAYRHFIASNGLEERLHALLDGLDSHDLAALQAAGAAARSLLLHAPLPADLQEAIVTAYRQLAVGSRQAGDPANEPAVAVRSSATAEDLPDASFAGQQETFLNVQGEGALLAACRRCLASLFTDRAISYRQLNGFDHFEVAFSIGVQQMVRADLAASGVMFSIDTETGFRDAVLLTAAYGLGENVVRGTVNPDEYLIFKPTLEQGFAPILQRCLGSKAIGDVGGKNASLGEMLRELGGRGVRVPDGFATTAGAYRHFIASNGLEERLHALLDGLDSHDLAALQAAGAAARSLLLHAPLPADL
ncbi:MAG: PEP/pyruvate-binding domain-containing protein, partial [Cyanobium sp.]